MYPRTDSDRQTFEAAMPEEYRSHSRLFEGTPASEALHNGANVQVKLLQQRNTTLPLSCREAKAAIEHTRHSQGFQEDGTGAQCVFILSAEAHSTDGVQVFNHVIQLTSWEAEKRREHAEVKRVVPLMFSFLFVQWRSSVSALARLSSIAMTPIFVWCRIPRAKRYHC